MMHSLQLVIVNKLFLLVWSVSWYVVGKGGQYMVSREGDVVGNNLRVVSMWLVQYVVGIWLVFGDMWLVKQINLFTITVCNTKMF